jgi:hypothetical protein
MLDLDSPRWAELRHAYGPASDIPGLLRQLADFPPSADSAEPWFSLWSSLAHQGEVYPASFAAVPHVIHAMAVSPDRAGFDFLQFPVWVEICRRKNGTPIPPDLDHAYFAALARLPSLVADAASREWDPGFLACAMAAVAVAKGQGAMAEAAMQLSPEVARSFLDWMQEQ